MDFWPYIIEECRHYGNKTKLDIVASYTDTNDVPCEDDPIYVSYSLHDTWQILRCCACKCISFAVEGEVIDGYGAHKIGFYVHYPRRNILLSDIPEAILKAYNIAIKARRIDESTCLISLRKVLEIICKQQGETSGDLFNKIINLANRGVIPSGIVDASSIIRKLGNAAVHADDVTFTEEQVNHLFKFTEMVIDYLYVLPKLKNKLENG